LTGGGAGAGGVGGSDSGDIWELVPEKRNMKNMGETCYLSTLLQLAHNNDDFRRPVANDDMFKFKEHTGLSNVHFVQLLIHDGRIGPTNLQSS
jgi:hypothetical protein